MSKFRTYIEDAVDELVNKVSWPTWEELQTSAIIVLVASVIIALVVFVMDYVFGINLGTPEDPPFWRGILGYFYHMF